ncbi:trypsin, alkaline B-like [Plutella xylostella]|uniref:trypsin, alkaline B-like n=1 Tax=Plutella xylostella TaxID=51655 RepID=UPI0020323825|nr:trypsin, alkaline B-like [Plutella xylostella]
MATRALFLLIVTASAVAASNRIVGGADASIEAYPAIVAIEYLDIETTIWSQSCGGNILSPTYVLTAAHCVDESPMRIRAGSSYRESGGTVINVKSSLVHPDYNKLVFLDADIALLKLEKALVYGPGIQQAAIYAQGTEVPNNSAVVHAGWGFIEDEDDGDPSPILQDVIMYTVNYDECARRYSTEQLTENMICSGYLGTGGKGPCDQDSGGPMYYNNVLVGLVSWFYGCASAEYPTINAKVSAFTDWIVANTV